MTMKSSYSAVGVDVLLVIEDIVPIVYCSDCILFKYIENKRLLSCTCPSRVIVDKLLVACV